MKSRNTLLIALFGLALLLPAAHAPTPTLDADIATQADEDGLAHGGKHRRRGDKGKKADKKATPPSKPVSAPTTAPEDILPNDGSRKLGDVTRCPVTGDVFTVEADTDTFTFEGKTYYLCCDGCITDIAADPKRYLAPKAPKPTP